MQFNFLKQNKLLTSVPLIIGRAFKLVKLGVKLVNPSHHACSFIFKNKITEFEVK
jgi:hypothetical protein